MATGRSIRFRRLVFVAIILVLLAAGVLWLLLADEGEHPGPGNGVAVEGEAADTEAGSVSVQEPDEPALPAEPQDVETVETGTEPDSPSAESERVDGTGDSILTVKAVNSLGDAVPDLHFEYRQMSLIEFAELRRDGDVDRLSFTPARFDSEGLWRIRSDARRLLLVRMREEGWVCGVVAVRASRRLAPDSGIAVIEHRERGDHLVELTVFREMNPKLYIEYADGEPYEGEFGWTVRTTAPNVAEPLRSRQVLTYSPGMTIPAKEDTVVIISVIDTPRAGFKRSHNEWVYTARIQDNRITFVIPMDTQRAPPSGLILDHRRLEPGQSMVVAYAGRSSTLGPGVTITGPGETRTQPVREGWWRVMAFGDGIVWASEMMYLGVGEWRRVTLTPEVPAELSLRVVDPDGAPLPGAFVSVEEAGHVSRGPLANVFRDRWDEFPDSRSDPQVISQVIQRARANADGWVTFPVAFPGTRAYLVEAVGFEHQRIEVSLASGQRTEYGTVTLQPATATVTVRLTDAEELNSEDYVVRLLIPFSGSVTERPVPFKEGVAVIESVPAHRYQVAVTRKEGGQNWSRMLDVQPHGEYEVEIDVRKDFGMQED
jgi:hypothetical protein